MLIAATYDENGEIFQHFGRTPMFKVYQVENGEIVAEGGHRTGRRELPRSGGHHGLCGQLRKLG